MTFWALFIIAAFGSGIFSLSKFLYRSADDFDNYKISNDNRKIIHTNLKELGISSIRESDWWAYEDWIQNLTLDVWENDIIKSDIFLTDCKIKIENLLTAMRDIEL